MSLTSRFSRSSRRSLLQSSLVAFATTVAGCSSEAPVESENTAADTAGFISSTHCLVPQGQPSDGTGEVWHVSQTVIERTTATFAAGKIVALTEVEESWKVTWFKRRGVDVYLGAKLPDHPSDTIHVGAAFLPEFPDSSIELSTGRGADESIAVDRSVQCPDAS